jgi:hypothetical protein
MNKEEMNEQLKKAKEAETTSDFFKAAHFYKEAVEIAKNLGDSDSIILCKKKIIEMNQKSKKEFRELHVEQNIPKEEIDKIIGPILEGSTEDVLKKIGIHPFLFPNFKQVEDSAKKSIPLSHQIADLSCISPEGHLVKGGSDGDYSWGMLIYGIHQGLITNLYLDKVFSGLKGKGINEISLIEHLRSRNIFSKNNLDIISVGIERYFKGDYESAIHILIPQFENVFLDMSEKIGIDVISLNRGKEISTQLKTLSIEHLSSENFQKEWGRDFCEQLKFVLFEPLGYILRHKVCHGQITKEECNVQTVNLLLYFYLVIASRVKRV